MRDGLLARRVPGRGSRADPRDRRRLCGPRSAPHPGSLLRLGGSGERSELRRGRDLRSGRQPRSGRTPPPFGGAGVRGRPRSTRAGRPVLGGHPRADGHRPHQRAVAQLLGRPLLHSMDTSSSIRSGCAYGTDTRWPGYDRLFLYVDETRGPARLRERVEHGRPGGTDLLLVHPDIIEGLHATISRQRDRIDRLSTGRGALTILAQSIGRLARRSLRLRTGQSADTH